MKELKFKCPSCGQHIQCDWKHAGENVPCPGCATLIRVPLEGDLDDATVPAPATGDTEKVSYTAPKMAADTEPKKSPAPSPSAASTPIPPVAADKATPATAQAAELHCVCPVCQSELRISVEPDSARNNAPAAAKSPAPSIGPLPLSERERQIAAARARTLHTTSEKPHLDRILSGGTVETFPPLEDK